MKNSCERIGEKWIASVSDMERAIRDFGILPFFKCAVPGWSVEEMTAPGFWFFEDDVLGPWDWKVDVVQRGDIAYGKFLGGKAAFATVECYRNLIAWRRSLPRFAPSAKEYASLVYGAIQEHGALGSKQLRGIVAEKYGVQLKKGAMDSILQFLQMGTWVVVGDMERVYRGPDLTYSGWQLSSNTTPDALFGLKEEKKESPQPSWARRFQQSTEPDASAAVSDEPAQARELLLERVLGFAPQTDRKTLEKII